jgi:aryl-alcohol dehydrogenase-like predicted oxidoreductase
MDLSKDKWISRRRFLKTSAAAAAALTAAPYLNCGKIGVPKPMTRQFGQLDFDVTTLGLGGQASIQWTPPDIDPVQIILKAFHLGVNYYDTSNFYGPSQLNYGKAFRKLDLIPGQSGYNEKLRRSIFLTSKTHLRWAKGGKPIENVHNWTNGPKTSHTVDDLKRSLSQIFGDGLGNYPEGAYLDMVLIHDVSSMGDVEATYEELADPDPKAEHIGALAALRDYRDGTNKTGLNPKEEKRIRHIGFSGHYSAPVMMEMIQRDKENLLQGMLIAINANDRLYTNMQYNVIPVASAKNMGTIGMKVFADGAMYDKNAQWSYKPEHVVLNVGAPELESRLLVAYTLTTPGIHTAIIGIGKIDKNAKQCQLKQNLSAAQIQPNELNASERRTIEKTAATIKEGQTNYFQMTKEPLSAPMNPEIRQYQENDKRIVQLTWHSAYAGDEPINHYEVRRDNQRIAKVKHVPKTDKSPFTFVDYLSDTRPHSYQLLTIDRVNRSATSEPIILLSID